jgi:hypothetical protein
MESRFCSTCGSAVIVGERFCRQCGASIVGSEVQGGGPAQPASSAGYAMPPAQPYTPPYEQTFYPSSASMPGWPAGAGAADPTLLQFDVQYPASLSRGLIFIKWLLIIPHLIVFSLYAIAMYVVTIIAWFAILFTGNYPRGMFDFVVNGLRWGASLNAYYLLLRDEYPPFSGADGAYAPLRLSLAYPPSLSRGLIFIKWLLVIPNFIVVGLLNYVAGFCVFLAWFAILFTGRYPEGMFNFVVGVTRWQLRALAYYILLTDRYPPFTTAAVPGTSSPGFAAA